MDEGERSDVKWIYPELEKVDEHDVTCCYLQQQGSKLYGESFNSGYQNIYPMKLIVNIVRTNKVGQEESDFGFVCAAPPRAVGDANHRLLLSFTAFNRNNILSQCQFDIPYRIRRSRNNKLFPRARDSFVYSTSVCGAQKHFMRQEIRARNLLLALCRGCTMKHIFFMPLLVKSLRRNGVWFVLLGRMWGCEKIFSAIFCLPT